MKAEYITIGEAAEKMGTAKSVIRKMVISGEIPGIALSHTTKIKRVDFENYLQKAYTGNKSADEK